MRDVAENLTKTESSALRTNVKEAIAAETASALVVAQTLYRVFYGTTTDAKGREITLCESWGFPDHHDISGSGFNDWVEHELHWHMSKARSYVRIWDELFTRRGLDPVNLPDSIQALRTLAKISHKTGPESDGELKKWITKSKMLSCCEFDAEVEDHFGFGKGKRKTMSFAISLNHVKRSKAVIQLARAANGLSTTGEALVKILEDWRAAHEAAAGTRSKAG